MRHWCYVLVISFWKTISVQGQQSRPILLSCFCETASRCWTVWNFAESFVKLPACADDAGTLWNLVELVLLLLEHCEAFVKLVLVNYQWRCWNIVKLFRMQTFIIGSEVALALLALDDVSKLKTFQFIEQRTQWHLHNCSFLCKVSNCLIFQIDMLWILAVIYYDISSLVVLK